MTVAFNDLVEATFKFYSTKVLQSFSIACVLGEVLVPVGAQAPFLYVFSMLDETHLVHDDADPIGGVL